MKVNEFTKELKRLRKSKGLTQKQVSEESGIPLGCLKHWEAGIRRPNFFNICKLADYYEVDYRELTMLTLPDKRRKVMS